MPPCTPGPTPGQASVVVSGPTGNIYADDSGLFWISVTEKAGRKLWSIRQRHSDGHETVVVPPRIRSIWRLVTDESHVYFSSEERLLRVPKKGGEPRVLAVLKDGPKSLALGKDSLFWNRDKEIFEVPVQGGKVRKVVATEKWIYEFVVNDSRAFWTENGPEGQPEAMGTTPTGTPERFIVPDAYFGGVDGVGFDEQYVYWNEGKGFFRRPLAGGPPQPLAAHQDTDLPLYVDGTHIYGVYPSWHAKGAHGAKIVRIPKTGGCLQVVAEMPKTPEVAFDDKSVYWRDATSGDITTIPK